MEMMIVAGEASGDAHAAELMEELRRRHPALRFFGCGGPRMAAAGCELLVSASELAVVGLLEVVRHLPRIHGLLRRLRRALRQRRPMAVILVDFPDFNLRLAAAAAAANIPAIYFVSPQLWAWRSGRVRQIQRHVRRMICIFPFEQAFYSAHGVEVDAVGHPLVERIASARVPTPGEFRSAHGISSSSTIVALLPGSRRRELEFHLQSMLEAARCLHAERDIEFVLPVAATLDREAVAALIPPPMRGYTHLIDPANAYAAVAHARLAVVASGTATVETALLGTPMIVVYRLSRLSYQMGRRMVKLPRYAMVNLIAEREVVPELIQSEFEPSAIVDWAHRLLDDGPSRAQMVVDLEEVRRRLGQPGAIARAATAVERALAMGTA
ncbi:MAG TPA: lipid-A-disaccharide synthase [Terriglobales bacterium]|nr:lipid-A-disaccharide synthase [Terriglobales bacterium]